MTSTDACTIGESSWEDKHCRQEDAIKNNLKYMIKRIIYDLFNIIPPIIPRPRVDIRVSWWYTCWYGKCHLLISILKIYISSDIQFNLFFYLIIIILNHLSIRKFKFSTWRTVTLEGKYFEFIGYKLYYKWSPSLHITKNT
jgi:hypothetical protein